MPVRRVRVRFPKAISAVTYDPPRSGRLAEACLPLAFAYLPCVTFPADRRIRTSFGVLDVVVEHHPSGVTARLARPEDHPGLSAVSGTIGQNEDEAVERLREGVERLGSEDPNER